MRRDLLHIVYTFWNFSTIIPKLLLLFFFLEISAWEFHTRSTKTYTKYNHYNSVFCMLMVRDGFFIVWKTLFSLCLFSNSSFYFMYIFSSFFSFEFFFHCQSVLKPICEETYPHATDLMEILGTAARKKIVILYNALCIHKQTYRF